MKTTLERKEIVQTATLRIELETEQEIKAFETVIELAELKLREQYTYHHWDVEISILSSLRKALKLTPEKTK